MWLYMVFVQNNINDERKKFETSNIEINTIDGIDAYSIRIQF